MDARTVPCLRVLMAEFDAIAPGRDHASDGSIGDAAHFAGGTSSHIPDEMSDKLRERDADHVNEIHAIDVDNNLRASFTMEDCVQFLVGECRKAGTSGQDRGRLRNIIYNRRIWSASSGWAEKAYSGASAHTEHAHFDVEYISSMEADTRTWGLIERFGEDMPSAEEIADAVVTKMLGVTTQGDGSGTPSTLAGQRILNQGIPDGTDGEKRMAWQVIRNIGAQVVLARKDIATLAGRDFVDEQAVASAVLAGLAPAALTDAVVNALQALPAETAALTVETIQQRLAASPQG